jgi:GNAT superfamily N-acetyltransferase
MEWRTASASDVPLLADMNRQLREDEAPQAEPLNVDFEQRMRGWLAGEYSAVLFEVDGRPVAYVLWRDNEGRGIYLRQFFVDRTQRRRGLGRQAVALLVREVLPPGTDITLEVLGQNPGGLAFWNALGFGDYARTLVRRGSAPSAL